MHRSRYNRILGGVLGGISEDLGVEPMLIRFLFFVAMMFTGFAPGCLIYGLLWLILPEA